MAGFNQVLQSNNLDLERFFQSAVYIEKWSPTDDQTQEGYQYKGRRILGHGGRKTYFTNLYGDGEEW